MALALNTSGLAHCSQRSQLKRSDKIFAPGAQRVHALRPDRVSQCFALPACVVPHACACMEQAVDKIEAIIPASYLFWTDVQAI